jgi:hypothetical protein
MKWSEAEKHQIIANLPLGGLLDSHAGLARLLAGLRTCRHGRSNIDRRFY